MSAVFGAPGRTLELDGFGSVTDIGILSQWCHDTFDRAPADDEIADVQSAFLKALERAANEDASPFDPTPGLRRWIAHRAAQGGVLGIATGGWGMTARWKLRRAGLDEFELPLASSDDAAQRTEIMRIALERSGGPSGESVTYVGDGPWDLAASRALGWDFIGIASGTAARHLRASGARLVIDNFNALLPAAAPTRAYPS
ncbi:MAG: haloacid dehalogenase-like hydrolase [Xanthomonadales bacterium]|nr:haloacid dehalogenase-like hydrolase [Xanthomonadales bacterium]